MRVNGINAYVSAPKIRNVNKLNNVQEQKVGRFNVISMSEYMKSSVSFRGRNKEQAIFYGAEVAPFSKAGGVGVVMKDYGFILDPKDEVVVSPYYRADVNTVTGEVTPAKNDKGEYILHTNDGDKVVDLVAEKNMQWGNKKNNRIMLFSLREEQDKVHYFVFDDSTAFYKKPYEGGAVYATGSKSETNAWNGDPYAKNSKAFVELLPELIKDKKDFNPATVVCSDSQTAYTHEYMVQKAVKEEKGYDEIKTTHVGHNLGPGYCGETSMQNMFVNLGATPEQIKEIETDPIYKQGLLGDNYFKPFVKETLDETGTASATQIALKHAQDGFVRSFSVVAEDYAESIAQNPQAAYNIHETVKPLYQKGIFNGILNPLEDTSIDATKKLPNALYNIECKDTDGKTYEAFEVYPQNASYETMRGIKNRNKARLLDRLSAKDSTIITGNKNRTAEINPEAKGIYNGPVVRPELIKMIKQGKGDQVPLFLSWGRIDTQKGLDIALTAFEKFAKTKEGKNAIFILGAGLDKGDESKRVANKVTEMLKDPDLQGRIVHIAGWAPAYAMASAGDAAVFTSRFEPCGLTDIEAMKYYCSPIVTNTQGFKQKNFDPRIPEEAHKATSFKTQHEFDLLKSQVEPIIAGYVNGDEDAKRQVQAEYPIFWKEKNGQKVYDDSAFIKFGKEYSEFISAKEQELKLNSKDGTLPEGWNDWDNLSRNYSFKYTGFARDLKDEILSSEAAEAISEFVNRDKHQKEFMFDNLKALQTGWKNNQVLHPTNQSSFELYKERHMMSDYSKPESTDVISKDSNFVEKTIESRQQLDLGKRVGTYLLGALTGVVALIGKRTNNAEVTGIDDKLKTQVEELTKKLSEQEANFKTQITNLAKNNKRNLLFVGLASALGAGILTFFGTKLLITKKQQKMKKDTKAEENVPKVKVEATPLTKQQISKSENSPQIFSNFN